MNNNARAPDQKELLLLKKRAAAVREIQRFLLRALCLFILLFILFHYVIGLLIVPGNDMYPRLDTGDLIVYYRLSQDYLNQDVVCIRKLGTRYVSRIVGRPGDIIEVEDNALRVNGNRIQETGIFYPTPQYEGYVEYPLILGEGEYFCLGDHREGAEDSRYFGAVDSSEIEGLVIMLIRRNGL